MSRTCWEAVSRLGHDRAVLGLKRVPWQNGVDVDELFRAVDRIKNPPVPHGILAESRKVVRDGFMAQVVDIGGQPLALVEEPLSHGPVD